MKTNTNALKVRALVDQWPSIKRDLRGEIQSIDFRIIAGVICGLSTLEIAAISGLPMPVVNDRCERLSHLSYRGEPLIRDAAKTIDGDEISDLLL